MKIIVQKNGRDNCPFTNDEFVTCNILSDGQVCDCDVCPEDCPLRKGQVIVEMEK